MLQVSTSTLKRRFNELKSQHRYPVKWPYFRDSYAFFSQQVHTHQNFPLTGKVKRIQSGTLDDSGNKVPPNKGRIEYILNDQEIVDPRIIEAETLGTIYKAHVQVYRRDKLQKRSQGEHVEENMIVNPQIMSIKRNSMHPWQLKSSLDSQKQKKTSKSTATNTLTSSTQTNQLQRSTVGDK